MPDITLFPVGELFNHDNVETYYIYQRPEEKPDATTRYSGIVDENDHDDELITKEPIINLTTQLILNINQEFKKNEEEEKIESLKKLCAEIDAKEENEAKEHKKYRPPEMDLTESDEKEASICAGPNEHYLPGSEIYMSYGRYSNRQLLSTYGFALKENYYNYAKIRVLLKELAENEEQAEFLTKMDAYCNFKLKKKEISLIFLRALRGLYWKNEYPTKAFFEPVLPELEIKVVKNAIRILRKVLDQFPTSLEEDLTILTQEIPLRKYFAVLYRSQVKDILVTQLRYVEATLAILEKIQSGETVEDSFRSVLPDNSGEDYLENELVVKGITSYFDGLKNSN